MDAVTPMTEARTNWRYFGARSVYLPDFLDGFDRLVAFDAETTGKRTPDAEFIRRQPFAWKAPGIIIEVGFVEMLRDGKGWRKGETWGSRVNPDGPIDPDAIKIHGIRSADLKNAPRFPTILPRVRDFVGESPIVAHAYKNEEISSTRTIAQSANASEHKKSSSAHAMRSDSSSSPIGIPDSDAATSRRPRLSSVLSSGIVSRASCVTNSLNGLLMDQTPAAMRSARQVFL
jgi:hypothetical protein